MASLILILPALIVLLAVAYLVTRALTRAFLEYRVKQSLLRRLDRKPDLIGSLEELNALVDADVEVHPRRARLDLGVTGAALAVMGLGLAWLAQRHGVGQWAVGAYLGGVVSVFLGALLALAGLVVRLVGRSTRQLRKG